MNHKKKFLKIFFSLILVITLIYYLYPKSVLIDDIFFKNCNKENITLITLRSTTLELEKSVRDKDEINKIMSALSKIKLVEYHGIISRNAEGVFDIWIWETYDMTSELYIISGQYIIDNSNNNRKVYKIIDDSLDISYMEDLISK